MIITKGINIRIYPNRKQQNFINKMIGAVRVVYNTLLFKKQEYYKKYNKTLKIDYNDLYVDFPWLKELDANGLQQTRINLDKAYNNWFNSLQHKSKLKYNFPKYKIKQKFGSYNNTQICSNLLKTFKEGKIKLPKLGYVKYAYDLDISKIKNIRNITIKKTKTNKFFVSLCCDYEVQNYEHTGNAIGLDLGIKDLIIPSVGKPFDNKNILKQMEKKIKHLQRNCSRKQKGSKNQEKTRLKLAIAYEKLGNKRKDYLHKITTKIVKENSIICIEDLNVKGMMKNHHLAKSIQDCSFSTIRRLLEYKCQWYNRKLVIIDRWTSTSKTCNKCGYIKTDLTLKDRTWTCPKCGIYHDRDKNAAINILNEGMKILDTVGNIGIKACGEDSSVVKNTI